MKTFAGFIVGIMLAGSVCGLGRRHPQPALPGGFPAKGTFVLTDADGRVRFDLEFGKDSLRSPMRPTACGMSLPSSRLAAGKRFGSKRPPGVRFVRATG